MTAIRINKGDAFTVTAHYVPSNPSSIRTRSRAAANRADAVAMARELVAHKRCALVTMHDESGALQGFAPGSASVDLFDADSGFVMHVPVYLSDTLPGIFEAISAYDASKGAETMPGLIELYAAHDAANVK